MTPLLFPLFPSAHPRCYLDMAKVLVFRYLYWFVLSVVFVTGATRISVFGLGYLLACFFFFLFGTQLLVKPARARLAVWDCLIIYNVAVIIAKNLLSVSEVLKKLQTHRTHLQTQITLIKSFCLWMVIKLLLSKYLKSWIRINYICLRTRNNS
jgi:hypothetical protein